MNISLSAICDYASISQGDKLNVMGVFDTITAPSFPVRHPTMSFAFRMRAEYEDAEREHRVRVALRDDDGQAVVDLTGVFQVGQVPPGGFAASNQIIAITDVVFVREGTYEFCVFIDDVLQTQHPLLVKKG